MKSVRVWSVVVAFFLVVMACGGDADETTTTTAGPIPTVTVPPTATVPPTVPPSTVPPTTAPRVAVQPSRVKALPFPETHEGPLPECFVSASMLRIDAFEDGDHGLNQDDIEGIVPGAVLLTADNRAEWGSEVIGIEAAEAVVQRTAFVDIQDLITNPSITEIGAVVGEAQNAIDGNYGTDVYVVSPVYGYAFETGHWSFEPGPEDYEVLAGDLDNLHNRNTASSFNDNTVVAVVDSGFPAIPGFPMLDIGLSTEDKHDLLAEDGTTIVSHGTFVASVIRQVAPDVPMVGARVDVSDEDRGNTAYVSLIPLLDSLRDGFQVEQAVQRVRDATNGRDVVLNLSFGARECPSLPPPNGLRNLLLEWGYDTSSTVRVIAAAGNRVGDPILYPAAYDFVDAISALNISGEAVLWNANDQRVLDTT
ncbi:MAG: S8/S53 family peptidase, partial [Acidimicrobiia bacterium]|nr:S8/S53 family peptidase [Acidimicrobiia bacterium]